MLKYVYETCTMALSLRQVLYFGNTKKTCEKIRTNKFSIVWLRIFTAVFALLSKSKWELAHCWVWCFSMQSLVLTRYTIKSPRLEAQSYNSVLYYFLVHIAEGKKVEVHLNPATGATSQNKQQWQRRPFAFRLLLLHAGVPTQTLHAIDVWPPSTAFGRHHAWNTAMRPRGALLVVDCPHSMA